MYDCTFLGIIPFFIGKFRPKVLFATTQCLSALSMLVFAAFNHFREYRQDLITRFFQSPHFFYILSWTCMAELLEGHMNSIIYPNWLLGFLFFYVRFMSYWKCSNSGVAQNQLYWHYGITGYQVATPGIQNQKDFCIKINIPKGNY